MNQGSAVPKRKVAIVMGTRPEAIKMAPIVIELRRRPHEFDTQVVATAQHRDMLDQVLGIFGIVPDIDLNLMTAGQTLSGLTVRLLASLDDLWRNDRPDIVIVQGDTTSSFVAGLAAYYLEIPLAHVEAGLRTGNKFAPFPEEMNRRLVDAMTDFYFPPTEDSRSNLLAEGVPDRQVHVTGNTGIDALLLTLRQNRDQGFEPSTLDPAIFQRGQLILVTAHRRESFGEGFSAICAALAEIARRCPDASLLYPVHPNPNVRGPAYRSLGGIANIHLVEPLDYRTFAHVMERADVILTDSGGIQEEAPSLGKPVLVMRDTTERVEAIAAGVAELVGTSTSRIVERTIDLLQQPRGQSPAVNPFGDGHAAERIVQVLAEATLPLQAGRAGRQTP